MRHRDVQKQHTFLAALLFGVAWLAIGTPSKSDGLSPALAALGSSSSEEEALAVLDTVADAEFRRLPFPQVEQLVHRGWWNASTKVVVRSHSARIDFTPAVRKAAAEVKKQGDILLKWLDRSFAHPSPTPMAIRWAQNTTAVMIVARFSPQWEGPGGANVQVFSSAKGRAHIDKEATAQLVQKLLRVNITTQRIEADITAEAGNSRKRFHLDMGFFDETVPERSSWTVEFRRAQGSMQMSSGASIPELHILLRKRWPGPRQWPRLTALEIQDGGVEPAWWSEAPGLSEDDTSLLRSSEARGATGLTCAIGHLAFCATSDSCTSLCQDQCGQAPVRHSTMPRCIGKPTMATDLELKLSASFFDEDLEPGTIGGKLHFHHAVSIQEAIEHLAFHWGVSATEALANAPPIATMEAYADTQPVFTLPTGTPIPSAATYFLVMVSNEAGNSLAAAIAIVDRVYPPPPQGLRFQDTDPARRSIGGTAELQRAENEGLVEAYEVHFGQTMEDGSVEAMDGARLATTHAKDGDATEATLMVAIDSMQVPAKASHLVAFSIGAGDVRSKPVVIQFQDACPPNVAPVHLSVDQDTDPRMGFAKFTISLGRGSCGKKKPTAAQKAAKIEKVCDEGTSVVVYFAHENGTQLGSPLADLPIEKFLTGHQFSELEIPDGVSHLTAIARNANGEMARGPQTFFADNKSETLSAWTHMRVLVGHGDGLSDLWRPFSSEKSPFQDVQRLSTEFGVGGLTALSLDRLGYDAFGGRDDGKIASLDMSSNKVWNVAAGVSTVIALAADGEKMQAVRAARSSILDFWDLNSADDRGRQLVGHTDDVVAINVDWAGSRATTGSLDNSVILWDLAKASAVGRLSGHTAGVSALATSWEKGLVLSGSYDETLRLWSLDTRLLIATLEGNSEAVKFVFADWEQMRALSVSEARTAKLWDLKSYECILTFQEEHESEVLAIHVEWMVSQAMVVMADGTALLWDLKEPAHNPLSNSSFGTSMSVATISPGPTGKSQNPRH